MLIKFSTCDWILRAAASHSLFAEQASRVAKEEVYIFFVRRSGQVSRVGKWRGKYVGGDWLKRETDGRTCRGIGLYGDSCLRMEQLCFGETPSIL